MVCVWVKVLHVNLLHSSFVRQWGLIKYWWYRVDKRRMLPLWISKCMKQMECSRTAIMFFNMWCILLTLYLYSDMKWLQAVLNQLKNEKIADIDCLRLVMLYALRFERENPQSVEQLIARLKSRTSKHKAGVCTHCSSYFMILSPSLLSLWYPPFFVQPPHRLYHFCCYTS